MFSSAQVPANSDFFPFVDLNAPRLRFMLRNATELTRLTSLPVPVLDLLRAESPPDPTLDPSQQSALERDARVRRAVAIRNVLTGGRLEELELIDVATVLVLRTSAAQCADPEVQNAWKVAARNIGGLTATYLSPAELAALWSHIRSTPCYRDARGPHKAWADLLAAVAARDAGEILARGSELLEASSALSRDERTYLTSVLATAYVRLGEASRARELLAVQWDRLDHGGELALSLKELRALAQADNHPALADTGAASSRAHTLPQ